jgi:hypothetical protein
VEIVAQDRVDAIAQALVAGATPPQQDEPTRTTARDVAERLARLGRELDGSGRTLPEYLRGWWSVGSALRDRDEIDPDLFVAMLVAAARVDPPPADPAWRTADLTAHGWDGYPLWERIVKSQVADLEDPARAGSARRAVGTRWDSYTPSAYLKAGVTGAFGTDTGGGDVNDVLEDGLGWDDLAEFALCGQMHG